jgi:hypothetical protein
MFRRWIARLTARQSAPLQAPDRREIRAGLERIGAREAAINAVP